MFELGYSNNMVVNYGKILEHGLLWLKEGSDAYTCRSIDAILGLVERYRGEAEKQGLSEIAQTLTRVPAYGAQTFLQASQCVRILNFALWLEGNYHNTLGCFDQYIYPYYKADTMGASPDGRRQGEPFGANYSISLFTRPDGPFSIIRSMTKPDLRKVMNGGPLTLEFHESMFNTPEATYQVGQFVKEFIRLGGHQLQLCVINTERMLDAQAHPEKYPLLIVRIWGWSAYFVELDRSFQDHVIARQEYSL